MNKIRRKPVSVFIVYILTDHRNHWGKSITVLSIEGSYHSLSSLRCPFSHFTALKIRMYLIIDGILGLCHTFNCQTFFFKSASYN